MLLINLLALKIAVSILILKKAFIGENKASVTAGR